MPSQLQSLGKQTQLLEEVQRAFEEFDAARDKLGEALLRLDKGQRTDILAEILTSFLDWRTTVAEEERPDTYQIRMTKDGPAPRAPSFVF